MVEKLTLEKYHFQIIGKVELAAYVFENSIGHLQHVKNLLVEENPYSYIKDTLEAGIDKAEIALKLAKEALDEINK